MDFFFVLSGFVIAYAYDDRWSKMSLKEFAKRRHAESVKHSSKTGQGKQKLDSPGHRFFVESWTMFAKSVKKQRNNCWKLKKSLKK